MLNVCHFLDGRKLAKHQALLVLEQYFYQLWRSGRCTGRQGLLDYSSREQSWIWIWGWGWRQLRCHVFWSLLSGSSSFAFRSNTSSWHWGGGVRAPLRSRRSRSLDDWSRSSGSGDRDWCFLTLWVRKAHAWWQNHNRDSATWLRGYRCDCDRQSDLNAAWIGWCETWWGGFLWNGASGKELRQLLHISLHSSRLNLIGWFITDLLLIGWRLFHTVFLFLLPKTSQWYYIYHL